MRPVWIVTCVLLVVTNLVLLGATITLSRTLRQADAKIREFGARFDDLSEQLVQMQTPNLTEYSVIHKRGDACPPGWKLLPDNFTESDGTHRDACVNPEWDDSGDIKFDYLLSGERVTMGVKIAAPVERKIL